MAWVTPSNQITGDIIAASTWNQNVVSNSAYLKGQAGVVTAFENGVTVALTLVVTGASTMTGGATITGLVVATYSDFTQGSTLANPSSGTTRLYAKTNGLLYYKNGATGLEEPVGSSGYARSFLTMGG